MPEMNDFSAARRLRSTLLFLLLQLLTVQISNRCLLASVLPSDFVEETPGDSSEQLVRVKRIIGGYAPRKGSYPWVVSIQASRYSGLKALFGKTDKHYCGGALIRPEWVVTAAHCLYSDDKNGDLASYLDPKMWHVRMANDKLKPNVLERIGGFFNRVYNAMFGYVKPQAFYHVQQIFHHPKYIPGTLEYDIALFQLKEAPVIRKLAHLDIIDLPEDKEGETWPKENQTCTAVGWGCSFVDGPPTLRLQSIDFPILSPQVCRSMYSAYINLTTAHEFCAGYHVSGRGICPGDSGGPLVCNDVYGEPRLAGVVSATHSTSPGDFPALFTRVSYFSKWINTVIAQNPWRPSKNNPFVYFHTHN